MDNFVSEGWWYVWMFGAAAGAFFTFKVLFPASRKKKVNLPPSPGVIPIVGSFPFMGAKPNEPPYKMFSRLGEKFGPITYLQLGHNPTIIVSSGDIAKQILRDQDHIFSSRPYLSVGKYIGIDYHTMSFAPSGPYFKRLRKLYKDLLAPKKISGTQAIREKILLATLGSIYQGGLKEGEEVINLSTVLRDLSLHTLMAMLFGWKGGNEMVERFGTVELSDMKDLIRDVIEVSGEFNVGDFITIARWLDLQGVMGRMKKINKRMIDIAAVLLKEYECSGKKSPDSPDATIVDMLLSLEGDDKLDSESITGVLYEKVWEALPTELLDKILTWLPPAAHFRFRAVCKKWNTLISCSGWLQHYAEVNSRPSCTIMCTLGARKAHFFSHSELKWYDMPYNPVSNIELDWELVETNAGLVCYQCNWSGCLWLCVSNPLTHSSRVLPPNYPHWDVQPSHCEILKLFVNRHTQTFKVVVLVHSSNPSSTVIYDSTTTLWTVHQSFPSQDFRQGSSFVWKSKIYLQCFSVGKLLAFDVDSGVWSEVDTQLPCHIQWRHFIINNNDRILLVQTSATVVKEPISVWILQTEASSSTLTFSRSKWVRLSISMPTYLKTLLSDVYSCFSQTDRICFSTSLSNKWISYTFATKSWRVMPTRGRRDAGYYFIEWEPRLDMDVEPDPL